MSSDRLGDRIVIRYAGKSLRHLELGSAHRTSVCKILKKGPVSAVGTGIFLLFLPLFLQHGAVEEIRPASGTLYPLSVPQVLGLHSRLTDAQGGLVRLPALDDIVTDIILILIESLL